MHSRLPRLRSLFLHFTPIPCDVIAAPKIYDELWNFYNENCIFENYVIG